MKKKLDGKKIRFMAHDRKYRSEPYPAVAPLDTKLNTYITGQHIDPNDPETKGNLTLKEITGEVDIKPAGRLKKFPHVINDEDPVLIIHNKQYDCRVDEDGAPVNNKDYTEAHFIILQNIVAPSKNKVTPKHKFYLEDKEAEAIEFVNNSDTIYEAEKLIREEANVSEYKDLVKLLNITVKDFHVDPHPLNDNRLKELLLKQARKDPDSISFAFSETGKDYLFLSKLLDKGIISKKQDGYYEGNSFIAIDGARFVRYMAEPTNDTRVSKWGRILKEDEAEIIA